jgi:serine phosphatase RsbU (regulator of sigma subunit)
MLRLLFFVIGLLTFLVVDASSDSLHLRLKHSVQSEKSNWYNELSFYYQNIDLDSSLIYAGEAIRNAKNYGQNAELSRGYGLYGKALIFSGQFNKAENYLDSAIFLAKPSYPKVYLSALISKALILEGRGLYDHALELYHLTLNLSDSLKLLNIKSQALNSLGIVSKNLEKHDLALEYFNEAIEIKRDSADLNGVAFILNNIGTVYDILEQTEKALEVYNEALDLNKELGNTIAVAYTRFNIGVINKREGDYDKALANFNASIAVAKEYEDITSLAYNYNQLGSLYLKQGKISKAEKYTDKSIEISLKSELIEVVMQNYFLKSQIAEKRNNYRQSLKHYRKYAELKDSIYSTESKRKVVELRHAYENSRIEKRVQILEREKQLQRLQLEQNEIQIRNRSLWMLFFLTGFLLIASFSVLLFRQVRQKRKANNLLARKNAEISQQNEEIKAQRDALSDFNKQLETKNIEIEAQKDELAEQRNLATRQRDKIYHQKLNLTDNITYAARIQKALLPPKEDLGKYFRDYFIFNQPQGIVGGDFYWVGKVDSKVVMVTADCTGHGVTGGFMSVMGISILNEIVLRKNITNPAKILNETRAQIISSLHQNDATVDNKDGMDMTVFCFDKTNQTYAFAAANQKAYIVNLENDALVELSGDNMPVSYYNEMVGEFSVKTGSYTEHDVFYMFSDGYPDQFGGRYNKKFLYKRFRKLVEKTASLPMKDQLDVFATTFYQWKGQHDQVDDLLVIGIVVE